MRNIAFLLTHVPNPRINKRISVALQCGKTVVICTRRKSQNVYEPKQNEAKHLIFDIDLPSSKHLIKRYIISQKYQHDAYKSLTENQPNLIYAEGLDSLMIANQYKANHPEVSIFYEVADLREYFIEKPKSFLNQVLAKIVARIERKNFIAVDYLIITSMKFYDAHYCDLIKKEKVIFMPNVPEPEPFVNYRRKDGGTFTIGFIGGIRYLKQMKMLVDAAEKVGCQVLFAGAGGTSDDFEKITEYCRNKRFVSFTGKYDYDRDIARLYGMVDCVYSVYDADNANVRIALPNKLYESVYCQLPIIVAKGTYLAELVEQWGVGVAVSHKDATELAEVLKRLSSDSDYYASLERNCSSKRSEINGKHGTDILSARFQELLKDIPCIAEREKYASK